MENLKFICDLFNQVVFLHNDINNMSNIIKDENNILSDNVNFKTFVEKLSNDDIKLLREGQRLGLLKCPEDVTFLLKNILEDKNFDIFCDNVLELIPENMFHGNLMLFHKSNNTFYDTLQSFYKKGDCGFDALKETITILCPNLIELYSDFFNNLNKETKINH